MEDLGYADSSNLERVWVGFSATNRWTTVGHLLANGAVSKCTARHVLLTVDQCSATIRQQLANVGTTILCYLKILISYFLRWCLFVNWSRLLIFFIYHHNIFIVGRHIKWDMAKPYYPNIITVDFSLAILDKKYCPNIGVWYI